MYQLAANSLDTQPLWTWFLLMTRFGGVFQSLPGVGTETVPAKVRGSIAIGVPIALVFSGVRADMPEEFVMGGLMILSEFIFGYLLGSLPGLITAGLAVAGQVAAGSIGLGQANLIDPSLGGNVSVLSKILAQFGTLVFLAIDGHHVIIKAASFPVSNLAIGMFYPHEQVVELLTAQFAEVFSLALTVSAPILITVLLTQFLLGLLTRFIPQVNIFIISLPLTVLLGIFIIGFSFPVLNDIVLDEFLGLEELAGELALQ